jgi:hypothetical protein
MNDKTGIALADGQLLWFFNKGDLVPSTNPLTVMKTVGLDFLTSEPKKKSVQFFRYSEDDRPMRYHDARNGTSSTLLTIDSSSLMRGVELDSVCTLEVDLSSFPDGAFTLIRRNPGVVQVKVKVTMRLAGDSLSASVGWENGLGLKKTQILCQESNIPY